MSRVIVTLTIIIGVIGTRSIIIIRAALLTTPLVSTHRPPSGELGLNTPTPKTLNSGKACGSGQKATGIGQFME